MSSRLLIESPWYINFEQNFIVSKVFQPIILRCSLTRGLQAQGIALLMFWSNQFMQHHLFVMVITTCIYQNGEHCSDMLTSSITCANPRWGTLIFFIRRLGPSIYCLPSKKTRNSKHPQKMFEIFANTKKYPDSVFLSSEKTLKYIKITPKTSPILRWPPQNKYPQNLIPPKIFIFWTPPPPPKKKKKKKRKKENIEIKH